MANLTNFIIFSTLVVLVYFTVQSAAIQCYHCHSYLDSTCGDPFEPDSGFNSSVLIDCDSLGDHNYTYCRKTIQTATLRSENDDRNTIRVIRSCGYLPEPKLEPDGDDDPANLRCYRRTGIFAVEVHYCACHADGCNSADWRGATFAFIFVSAFLSMLNKWCH